MGTKKLLKMGSKNKPKIGTLAYAPKVGMGYGKRNPKQMALH